MVLTLDCVGVNLDNLENSYYSLAPIVATLLLVFLTHVLYLVVDLVRLLGGDDGVDEAGEGDVAQLGGAHVQGGQLHLGRGKRENIRQTGERRGE